MTPADDLAISSPELRPDSARGAGTVGLARGAERSAGVKDEMVQSERWLQ